MGQITDRTMKELFDKLPEVVLGDRAATTTTQYANGFQRWSSWARARSQPIQVLPASPLHVSLYLMSIMQTCNTPAPVMTAFYSIAWAHRIASLQSPTDNPLPKSVLESAKRTLSKAHKRKEPLTPSIIQNLCAKYPLETASLLHIRSLALIVIGFAGFLRSKELANIRYCDIVTFSTHVAIFIEKSKTDKYREGSWVIISRTDCGTCPVKILERYTSMCGFCENSEDFIFRSLTKCKSGCTLRSANIPMSYSRMREVFIDMLKDFVPNVNAFGLHSLRSGGATQAAKLGIPDRLIKKHGRWASDAAKDMYIREALIDKLKVSRSLGL